MKQKLRFTSEMEFQSFFGQLASAEIPDFQAIEGSGGDMGFDGFSKNTAYQAYFPDEKNRTDKKYVNKIDTDLSKALANSKKLGIEVTRWIFVVPEDLRTPVFVHLQKKGKEAQIDCLYWGATKLTELASKYPHVINSFPLIFIPSLNQDIKEIKDIVRIKNPNGVTANVKIVTDDDITRKMDAIIRKYQPRIDGFHRRSSGSFFHPTKVELAYISEMQNKKDKLTEDKMRSDKAYTFEVEEILSLYQEKIKDVETDFSNRGLFSSGMKEQTIGRILVQMRRDLERLSLTYGVSPPNLNHFSYRPDLPTL